MTDTLSEAGEERIVALLWDAGFKEKTGHLTYKEWKDGIDIERPTLALKRFVELVLASTPLSDPNEGADKAEKDEAYRQRNHLVAALAHLYPSGVARTNIPGWSDDWHGCCFIDLPSGQISYHFHDSHAFLFEDLPPYTKPWDGHDKETVHARVKELAAPDPLVARLVEPCEEEKKHAQELVAPYRKKITDTPALLSLLYDIDLLPEQITRVGNAARMIAVCLQAEQVARLVETLRPFAVMRLSSEPHITVDLISRSAAEQMWRDADMIEKGDADILRARKAQEGRG